MAWRIAVMRGLDRARRCGLADAIAAPSLCREGEAHLGRRNGMPARLICGEEHIDEHPVRDTRHDVGSAETLRLSGVFGKFRHSSGPERGRLQGPHRESGRSDGVMFDLSATPLS